MYFQDRIDAGRSLSRALEGCRGLPAVVYALPRGGVPVGVEVARELNAPLDLISVRKIGHPQHPEFAIGAVSEEGHLACDEENRARVSAQWFRDEVRGQVEEARRRRRLYLGGREPVPAEGKIAILVDDGIATGLTMLAAVRQVQEGHPARIVVAAPVASQTAVEALRKEVDELVVLHIPDPFFGAVSEYYRDFRQVDDEQVIRSLDVVEAS